MTHTTVAEPPGNSISCAHGHGEMAEVREFFSARYANLVRYCYSEWGEHGEDVCHTAYTIAAERYTHITFGLFVVVAREAARNLRIAEISHTSEYTIFSPAGEKTRQRLAAHVATADDDDHIDVDVDVRHLRHLARAARAGQPVLPGIIPGRRAA